MFLLNPVIFDYFFGDDSDDEFERIAMIILKEEEEQRLVNVTSKRSRKRKPTSQLQPLPPPSESSRINPAAKPSAADPYPSHPHPSPEECRVVRDELLALHGFPLEFAKYRSLRSDLAPLPLNGLADSPVKDEPSDGEGFNTGESVLDGVVSFVLSQNTTEANSQKAFASLKSAFPEWENVLDAEPKSIENAIRCGGLAPTKAACIKNMLSCLLEKKGKLCLEYLRDLTVDQVRAELSHFKGIGPKTVACVLMFLLQRDDMPVDTHIFKIAKAVGWVPEEANIKKTYIHLNRRIPDELKFDLNCLLYTHGKLCQKCTKQGEGRLKKGESCEISCPLLCRSTMFLKSE